MNEFLKFIETQVFDNIKKKSSILLVNYHQHIVDIALKNKHISIIYILTNSKTIKTYKKNVIFLRYDILSDDIETSTNTITTIKLDFVIVVPTAKFYINLKKKKNLVNLFGNISYLLKNNGSIDFILFGSKDMLAISTNIPIKHAIILKNIKKINNDIYKAFNTIPFIIKQKTTFKMGNMNNIIFRYRKIM